MEDTHPWLNPPEPPSPTERLAILLKRHGFALICLGLLALFGGLLLSLNRPGSTEEELDVNQLIARAETERAERLAAAAQAAIHNEPATLTVLSYPEGATVYLDRDSVGATPLRAYPVSSGAHVVSVAKGALGIRDTLVVLRKGQGATFSFMMQPDRPGSDARLAGAARTASSEAPERARTSEEDREEAGVVRVSAADVAAVPPSSEPARQSPAPSESAEPEPAPERAAAAPAPPRTSEGDADDVRWVETKAERQQRVSGYVQQLLEQRKQAEQPAEPAGRPLDSGELPLEEQQEQAREVIRKHGGDQDSTRQEKKEKPRGWW